MVGLTLFSMHAFPFSGGWIEAAQLGCLKLLHRAVNHSWVEAQFKCEGEGGYMAEPKTNR